MLTEVDSVHVRVLIVVAFKCLVRVCVQLIGFWSGTVPQVTNRLVNIVGSKLFRQKTLKQIDPDGFEEESESERKQLRDRMKTEYEVDHKAK